MRRRRPVEAQHVRHLDELAPDAIVIDLDGTVWRIVLGGTGGVAEELLPPGHPRPGFTHAMARSRR